MDGRQHARVVTPTGRDPRQHGQAKSELAVALADQPLRSTVGPARCCTIGCIMLKDLQDQAALQIPIHAKSVYDPDANKRSVYYISYYRCCCSHSMRDP